MLNYLLFLLLPTYLIHIPLSDSISLNLLEIIIIITITTNFYTTFRTVTPKKVWLQFYANKNISLPIILILAGFIFSYIINQFTGNWSNWSDGLGKLLDLIILPIIYGLSLSILIKLKKISSQKLLTAYFANGIIISIFGLFYFANNWLTFDNRLSIFFQSPNQLAIFIAPAILIGVHKLLKFTKNTSGSKTNSLLIFSSLSLLFFNLYQTFSLGAWIATLLSILYLIIIKIRPFFNNIFNLSTTFLRTIFAIIIITLICILNTDLFLTATNYQPQIPATSYDSRLVIYQVNQKIISTNWLQGVGINNFQNIYLSYQKYFPTYPQWAVPHAHNNLLHFWIEGGLLASLGLFLLIYNILLPKKIQLTPTQKSTSVLLSAIFIYFVFHGTIDVTIWTPSATILFFLLVTSYTINPSPK